MNEPLEILKLYEELLKRPFIPFPKKGGIKECQNQGVYIIASPKNLVLHVGRTVKGMNGINQRLNNHLRNQSSFSKKYLLPNEINLRNGCFYKYLQVKNARKRALVEALTSGLICPKHIGTGK
ncbi:MAG: hypothetical protein CVU05_09045 [Bacteroidetes bacterium HGW-Bacteroidetes-21]|jgi:Ribonuclease G/E|nr:MAG: hypothetical protein CVU05_09045 [Bacteroidetes bacterium HGW-Bacteroidetes-21]